MAYEPEADGRWRLTVEDALRLAAAIVDPEASNVVLPSTGDTLEVITSKNGCRRVDVPGDGEYAKHGWVKLMEQNKNKGSAAAKRARDGSNIVWILPLEKDGKHPPHTWGCVENGVMTKFSSKAIKASSWDEYLRESRDSGRTKKTKTSLSSGAAASTP